MAENNNTIDIYKKVDVNERSNYFLFVEAVYKADPQKKNHSGDVLPKLLGVNNSGGIRFRGNVSHPKLVVLYTSGEDPYWVDELDNDLGAFVYYGDNKKSGAELHKTGKNGNAVLKRIFELAASSDSSIRKQIPVILVFKKAGSRDVKFLGLAVPGIKGRPQKEWLTAVWGCKRDGNRFQNYKAYFTILDTSSGSDAFKEEYGINLAWLTDIENGNAYGSKYAPKEWKKYIDKKNFIPLMAKAEKYAKSKDEQLPQEKEKKEMLKTLHDYFIEKDRGYSFEQFAADMIQYMDDSTTNVNVTRPYKDGGFDAVGDYKVFSKVDNPIFVNFYLQAKCYSESNAVVVSDTSRLISRIKNRQFGILFTTSYIAKQAYEEILKDKHPIVIVNGKNIIDYIFNELEIKNSNELYKWLKNNY